MTLRRLCAAAMVAAGLAIAGCGTPGGGDTSTTADTDTQTVKTEGLQDIGPVTLRVVSSETSGGPREAMRQLTREFEQDFPNVDVQLEFRAFAEWINAVRLQLQGDSPPDVVAGNQGYQVDGALVKANLIKPLDAYADAYGWEDWYSPESLQQFRWTRDGQFGEGELWGIAQSGQSTGVFVNVPKLKAAGFDMADIASFDDFQAMLETLAADNPGEPLIMLGNKEQYEALHAWGMIQGAYTPAQEVRDWIFHKPGATFDTETNVEALQTLQTWAQDGYFGDADDYNGRGENDAAILFGRGEGFFFMGGNWNAFTIQEGLGDDVGFYNMPPGQSGDTAAIGSTSTPFHISSKSENPDVAAAYLNFINGPTASQALVDTSQVPAIVNASAEPQERLAREVQAGWQELVDAGGLLFYHDWSSPTMLETIGSNFQELMVGRRTPQEVATAIQEDWEEYDSQLGG